MCEPACELGAECLGTLMLSEVRTRSAIRDAVEVDKCLESEGLGISEGRHDRPALGMSENGNGIMPGDGFEHPHGVTKVSIEGVQMRVVAVAMAAVIPCDDAPTGVGEQWCKRVEGPREVGAAVHEHENWVGCRATLVHRDAHTIGINTVVSIWGSGAGERPDRIHVMRLGRRTVESCNEVAMSPLLYLRHPRVFALVAMAGALALSAGCAGDEEAVDALPPIRTTTTTTTTTTLPDTNRYFYEVRSGDTLSDIANGFGVPMSVIVELNGLDNPSDIREGQMLEIPQGFVIVTLPPQSTIAP
jgi:LysM repeat protein